MLHFFCDVAAGLLDRGMNKGDRFGLIMRNHPEFVETMVAASVSGCVFVPIDPRSKGEKLAYTLRHSECRGVVAADYALEAVWAVRDETPNLEWIVSLDSREEDGCPSSCDLAGVESLHALVSGPERYLDVRVHDAQDPLEIIYTSGTTGDPKGVVCSNMRYTSATFIGQLLGFPVSLTPHLLPVRRGLLATCNVRSTGADLRALLEEHYASSHVVTVLPEGVAPELARVQHTDGAEIGVFGDRHTDRTIVICALDNLGKGAAGQALQNANLALGLDETLGLRLTGVLV